MDGLSSAAETDSQSPVSRDDGGCSFSARNIPLGLALNVPHRLPESLGYACRPSVLGPVSAERSCTPRALHRWTGLFCGRIGRFFPHEPSPARITHTLILPGAVPTLSPEDAPRGVGRRRQLGKSRGSHRSSYR